eukprot:3291209-Pyramimonas_sp.AAC.1
MRIPGICSGWQGNPEIRGVAMFLTSGVSARLRAPGARTGRSDSSSAAQRGSSVIWSAEKLHRFLPLGVLAGPPCRAKTAPDEKMAPGKGSELLGAPH